MAEDAGEMNGHEKANPQPVTHHLSSDIDFIDFTDIRDGRNFTGSSRPAPCHGQEVWWGQMIPAR